MAYATVSALKSRAGKAAGAWDENTTPGDADLEVYLRQVSAEIDVAVGSYGYGVPLTDEAAAALEGLVADRALLIALGNTFPGDTGPAQIQELRGETRARVYGGGRVKGEWTELIDGSHPVLRLLALRIPSAGGANDAWSALDAEGEPEFTIGMKF